MPLSRLVCVLHCAARSKSRISASDGWLVSARDFRDTARVPAEPIILFRQTSSLAEFGNRLASYRI
jgi:hypothetical protein